jgi:hypothetical protein
MVAAMLQVEKASGIPEAAMLQVEKASGIPQSMAMLC